jgi:hypothetical protein
MMRRIRVFHRTDDGSILMQGGDHDLNSLFNRGGVFLPKNARVDYWIYSLFQCFLMQEPAMLGSLLLNKARSMVEVKVLLWEVWICSRKECLAVINRILIEWTVSTLRSF